MWADLNDEKEVSPDVEIDARGLPVNCMSHR